MVAWWWVVIAFFIGVFLGMFVMALCAIAGQSDRETEKLIRPEHENGELELIG